MRVWSNYPAEPAKHFLHAARRFVRSNLRRDYFDSFDLLVHATDSLYAAGFTQIFQDEHRMNACKSRKSCKSLLRRLCYARFRAWKLKMSDTLSIQELTNFV